MCLYSMARHEHVLVGHTAQHDMDVGWVVLRIFNTWTLKAQHVKRPIISTFHFLMKVNLKFYILQIT